MAGDELVGGEAVHHARRRPAKKRNRSAQTADLVDGGADRLAGVRALEPAELVGVRVERVGDLEQQRASGPAASSSSRSRRPSPPRRRRGRRPPGARRDVGDDLVVGRVDRRRPSRPSAASTNSPPMNCLYVLTRSRVSVTGVPPGRDGVEWDVSGHRSPGAEVRPATGRGAVVRRRGCAAGPTCMSAGSVACHWTPSTTSRRCVTAPSPGSRTAGDPHAARARGAARSRHAVHRYRHRRLGTSTRARPRRASRVRARVRPTDRRARGQVARDPSRTERDVSMAHVGAHGRRRTARAASPRPSTRRRPRSAVEATSVGQDHEVAYPVPRLVLDAAVRERDLPQWRAQTGIRLVAERHES